MAAPVITGTDHWIGGEHVAGARERIDVVNPATEQVIASVSAGGSGEVDQAVAAAAAALPQWSATPVAERAAVVGRISDGLKQRADEIAATITAEVGSPITFASKVQVGMPANVSRGVAEAADQIAWTEEIGNSLVVREPVGVVGAITPWNYPLNQMVAKLAPALLAGCTMVLKPSEVAPLTAGILAEIARDAGVPAGVFNVVHGYGPEAGEALVTHPNVDMVSFTGSTRAGRRISALAAESIKRVALEMGGKSANVVLPDADLEVAAKLGIGNCYINGGQTCTAWSRMLVPQDKHDEVVEYAVKAASKYAVGDPTDPSTRVGPMVSAPQRDRVAGYLQQGIDDGATVAHGGTGAPDGFGSGFYIKPTIFSGVKPDSVIAQEEIFGPVLSVIPYADEDEAVEIANSTIYGLSGAVFSGDQDRAIQVARRMRTGQVDVNGGAFNPRAPFGGFKQSGIGREFGRYGIEEFLEIKSIQR